MGGPEIPRHIYQTWHTKDLPPKMRECVDSLRADNPEFEHHLFDDADCRAFVQQNFGPEVLSAYDTLVPGAYKADLWRYCVLFKMGGVYLDIKYKCASGFKIISLIDDERFVKDMTLDNEPIRVYNAFMVTRQNSDIMKKCIHKVIENVSLRYYGESSLHPTGPAMMPTFFMPTQLNRLNKIRHSFIESTGEYFIEFNDQRIFEMYPEYKNEQYRSQKTQHYDVLWKKRAIYANAYVMLSMKNMKFM